MSDENIDKEKMVKVSNEIIDLMIAKYELTPDECKFVLSNLLLSLEDTIKDCESSNGYVR